MIKTGSYLDLCIPEVRELFFLISQCKNMLNFSKQAEKVFTVLKQNDKYAKFLPLIEENLIIQLLKQISKLYKSISFDRFKKILGFFDFRTCEKMILYSNLSDNIRVRIDYDKKLFLFVDDSSIASSMNNGVVNLSKQVQGMIDGLVKEQMRDSGE